MSNLERILAIGTSDQFEEKRNNKIKVSNFVALFYGLLSVPFMVITYKLVPAITYIPSLFTVTAILCFMLNALRLSSISRFVLSTFLLANYIWYAGSITPNGEPFITPLYSIFMVFIPIPLLVYNLEERAQLLVTFGFVALAFFSTPYLIDLVSAPIDEETLAIFKSGWMSSLAYLVSFLALVGSISFFSYSVYNAEKKSTKLLQLTEEKTKTLQASEQKLNETLSEVQRAREEDRKRQWASEGLAKIAELLRVTNVSADQMYYSITSFLVKYMDANQGGLFLLESEDEQDPYLNLQAMYAYERRKFLSKRYNVGQGLIGQVMLEKQPMYITDIPKNYISITSGLGDAPPTALLLMPLKVENEVCGVFEMASFKKIEPYRIEFLEKACENIASTVTSIRVNEKTKHMLELTRQQTEEMRAQEEEMRQNMEELQSTQEEMQRKEKEYLRQISRLEEQVKKSVPQH